MDSCLLIIDMKKQSNKDLNFNKIGVLRCGEQTNQAILLEMPLVLPRSFLAPSVTSGIHEMILTEPTNVVLVEMIGNCNDSHTFELRWLPGMDEVT